MMQVIEWTEFASASASTATRRRGAWQDLIERISNAKGYTDKASCPWLKLGVFGERRTEKGSLRSDANLDRVYGVEADYDGEALAPEVALSILETAGIRAAIYTSPSHTPERPRWRVLAPLSRPVNRNERAAFVARLNGVLCDLFGAEVARESFTASQSYFFGGVTGRDYQVLTTFGNPDAGRCVDEVPNLPMRWPATVTTDDGERVSPDAKVAAWLETVARGAEGLHDALRGLAASFVAGGLAPEIVTATLFHLMDLSVEAGTTRGKERRAEIPDLVESAVAKYRATGFADAVEAARPDAVRYRVLAPADLLALPPPVWRIKGVLPAAGVAAVFGASASGKTFLALDMAAAIAAGAPWFGLRVRAAPVLYVGLEGEAGIASRVKAMEKARSGGVPAGLQLILQPWCVTTAQDVADLAAVAPRGGVVFIDTLNRAAPSADENSSRDMGAILEGAKTLARMTDGLVVWVHHSGKDAAKGMRGHSSLFAAMDAVLEVERSGNARMWSVAKAKDGQDGTRHGFALRPVALGTDADGDAVTSCVIEQQYLAAAPVKLGTQAIEALRILTELDTANEGKGVSTEAWRTAFYASMANSKLDTKKKAFQRACDALTSGGQVASLGDTHEPMEL
jgi:hypothetical protein